MSCRVLCLQWGKRLRFPLFWGGLAVGLSVLSSIGLRAEPPPQYLPLEAQWCLKSGTCLLLEVADKMVGHKLGEFAPTRTFKGHIKDKKGGR